jgi:hypothetical protein
MPLAVDALVDDAVAYDGIFVCWHRLLKLMIFHSFFHYFRLIIF